MARQSLDESDDSASDRVPGDNHEKSAERARGHKPDDAKRGGNPVDRQRAQERASRRE